MSDPQRVIALDRLRMTDVERVGGKNASLGEMISQLAGAGIRVPGGFATTAAAFREFLDHNASRRGSPSDSDSTSRTSPRSLAPAPRSAMGDGRRVSAGARSGDHAGAGRRRRRCAGRDVGGALVGDRRGSARGVLRWPAGNIS
jgi:hypothetical protein